MLIKDVYIVNVNKKCLYGKCRTDSKYTEKNDNV